MNENHTTSLSDMEIYNGENVSTYGVYEKIIVMMLSAITFFCLGILMAWGIGMLMERPLKRWL